MPKRRYEEARSDGNPEHSYTKRRKTSRSDELEGTLDNGKKILHRALRVSRGFERQKLGRRQKAAKEQDQSTEFARLTNEVTALKVSTMDMELVIRLMRGQKVGKCEPRHDVSLTGPHFVMQCMLVVSSLTCTLQ